MGELRWYCFALVSGVSLVVSELTGVHVPYATERCKKSVGTCNILYRLYAQQGFIARVYVPSVVFVYM